MCLPPLGQLSISLHLQHSGWAWYTQSVFAHEMIVFICKPRVLWLQPYSRRYCYRLASHVCVCVYGVCTILHVFDICLHIYTCSKERDTCNRQASKLRYAEWEWTRVKSHTRTHLQTRTPSIHTVANIHARIHMHYSRTHINRRNNSIQQQQQPAYQQKGWNLCYYEKRKLNTCQFLCCESLSCFCIGMDCVFVYAKN